MTKPRTYRVGTFFHPEFSPGKRVTCYTLWYDRSWAGCIEYDVEATSGAEAKKIARRRRLEHEEGTAQQ